MSATVKLAAVDAELELPPEDTGVSGHLRKGGVYEWMTTAEILRILRPGDVFVDVGANIGYHTAVAATRVGDAGAVWSFEPAKLLSDYLHRNVKRNGLSWVRIRDVAISDYEGRAELSVLEKGPLGLASLYRHQGNVIEHVEVRTLDSYRTKIGRRIKLIKTDTECGEGHVLGGMKQTIELDRPRILLEYYEPCFDHGSQPAIEFLEWFDNHGYVLDVIHDGGFRILRGQRPFQIHRAYPHHVNLLATPNEIREKER